MIKQALIALGIMGAVAVATPAEAHRDRVRTSISISYGSPGYYDHYYRPVYYRPRYQPYYYHQPRYRYRTRYYDDYRYYRPHKRHWKKRHWRRHHGRHW